MATRIPNWMALLCSGLILLAGCAPARQPIDLTGGDLQPGRYLQKYYRSPELAAAASAYQLDPFPLEQAKGLSAAKAASLFHEELLRAMRANGLRVNQNKPDLVVTGSIARFTVASPAWRFLSGRGHADLRVTGEIRRGQEILFAFQDEVTIAPLVNPRRQPPLETDLIARLAAQRFAVNLMNELLLVPANGPSEPSPAAQPTVDD